MNLEIFEFALHVAGVDDIPEVLHMRAPSGQTVLNPRIRGHVGEIARRFPRSVYSYHPELSRPAMSAWMWNRTMRSAHIVPRAAVPVVVSTAVVISASELSKTKTGNLGMQEIPGSQGGYTNPMGGGDSNYYPFKGFFDWLF